MKPVSTGVVTAFMSPTVQLAPSVSIQLIDNTNTPGLSASASTADAALAPASKATDGITAVDRKWAFADHFADAVSGGKCFPGSYPISTAHSAGWWGPTLSDSAGVVSPTSTLTLSYTPSTTVTQIAWWSDSYLSYPVDFSVDIDTGLGYTSLVSVTANTSAAWTYSLSTPTIVKGVRINITKISRPYCYAKLIEFQAGLTIDISNLVQSYSINYERNPDNATLEIGVSSAASLSLTFSNNVLDWSPSNLNGLYSKYLKSNRKIIVGLQIQGSGETATTLIGLGTFFSSGWNSQSAQGMALLNGQDRFKRLRERQFKNCSLYVNQSPEAIIASVLSLAGVNNSVLATTGITIPYAWCSPTTNYMKFITDIAATAGGFCYFDSQDVFHFEDANFLANNRYTSVVTLTDLNALITPVDAWSDADVKNSITVNVNAIKLAASATIWSLQETLTIPANSQKRVDVVFQGAATAIGAPVLTTSGGTISVLSWTAYAQGGTLIIQNTAATSGNVTAATIAGQLLQTDGANSITLQDDAGVQSDGERPLSVNLSYVQNTTTANTLATALLSLYKNPPARLSVKAIGLPFLELGDRVTVNSTNAKINGDYWLIRHSLSYDGGLISDMDLYACPSPQLPTRATLWHEDSTVTVGGAIAPATSGVYNYESVWLQSPAANGDTFTQAFWLAAGTYTMSIRYSGDTGRGKCTFSIDGTSIGTIDFNQGVFTANAIAYITPFTISSSGYHTLRGVVAQGFLGVAQGYLIPLSKMSIYPASDVQ